MPSRNATNRWRAALLGDFATTWTPLDSASDSLRRYLHDHVAGLTALRIVQLNAPLDELEIVVNENLSLLSLAFYAALIAFATFDRDMMP
jgi:hypothetical protein